MKFESKAHMAQELMSGKQFTSHLGGVIHYDPDPELTCPFRYGDTSIGGVWELYCKDIWTEVTPVHTHQALIDAYHEGQAWQFTNPYMNGVYADCTGCGVWIEPAWDERVAYRLHPHNTLIQEHSAGAKIQAYVETFGAWIEQANPDWDADVQYRVKPTVKVVYEVRALYTDPQPKREPLSIPDVLRMFQLNRDSLPWDKNTFYRFPQDMLIDIVRSIEKAHGV
jgi:hypothetical protein